MCVSGEVSFVVAQGHVYFQQTRAAAMIQSVIKIYNRSFADAIILIVSCAFL